MRIWLPHSRNARISLALLVFLAGGVLLLFFGSRNDQTANTSTMQNESYARKMRAEELNKDTDGDGLKDWEEGVFRTDPSNSDSDGDGTNDGEEVRTGRNPLQKGPNDLLATSTPIELATSTGAEFSPSNLTHRLAGQFNLQYLLPLLTGGATADQIDLDQLGGQVVDAAVADFDPLESQNLFTKKDIVVSMDGSKESYTRYRDSFSTVTKNAYQKIKDHELVIFSQALQKEDYSLLKQLDTHISAYNEVLAKLTKIPAPAGMAEKHIKYLNAVLAQKIITENMRNAEADILAAVVSSRKEIEVYQAFLDAAAAVVSELKKAGVF